MSDHPSKVMHWNTTSSANIRLSKFVTPKFGVLILFTAEVRVVGALVPAPTEVFLPVLHILQARLYADTPAFEDP